MTIYEWFVIALVIATFGSLALLGGIFYWGRRKVKVKDEDIVGDVPRVEALIIEGSAGQKYKFHNVNKVGRGE